MSRSYKKTPSCHVVNKDSEMKTLYSRKLRRTTDLEDIPSGNAYRKMNETWDIDDWHEVGTTYEEFRKLRIDLGTYTTKEECRQAYEKYYLRK